MEYFIKYLKIAVIGYGSIGKRHIQNLLNIKNIEIIICTKQNIKNPNIKKIKIVKSILECIEQKPDIGIITNETSKHVKVANQLVKQDVDVFIEKPLSNSTKDLKILKKTIEKQNIVSQMGCNFRFHPCIIKMKQIIENGVIGKIISVSAESGSYLPDWHPYEDYRKGYAARDDLGGGIVLTCIHEIDYLYWILGDVQEVFSVTGKFSKLKVNSDDMSAIILKFKNNVIGELHLDYFQRPNFKSCKIRGEKGAMYWNSDHNEVKIYLTNKKRWKTVLKIEKYERNKMYVDEIKHFLKCVKTRKSTINDIKEGIRTLEISLGIKKSSKLKKMIRV
jgi:predicted dehydrogenase